MIKLEPDKHIINQVNIARIKIILAIDEYDVIAAGIKNLGGEIYAEKRAGSMCRILVNFGSFLNGAERSAEAKEKFNKINEFLRMCEYSLA